MRPSRKLLTGLATGILMLAAVSCQTTTIGDGTPSVISATVVSAQTMRTKGANTAGVSPTALATLLPTLSSTESTSSSVNSSDVTMATEPASTKTTIATVPTAQPTAIATPTPATATSAPANLRSSAGASTATQTSHAADFTRGTPSGMRITAKGLELTGNQGQFTSEEIAAAFPFDNLVVSWSADIPTDASFKMEARVRAGATWSSWYSMGTWTNGHGSSVSGQKDALGQVDVDTLVLSKPAQAIQYRVTLTSTETTSPAAVRSVTLAYADMTKPLAGQAPTIAANAVRDLAVPQISQAIQNPSIAWEICSPTSLTMVLNYWGGHQSLLNVVQGVQDKAAGIYGNWPLNTAYAATQGFDAHIARFFSLTQLENEIAQNRPVIVSINFKTGELSNAPISSTSGHLIVVRGFTANGDVIVNDPASPSNETVRRVYQRNQFNNVWLNSGGIAYILEPAGT